MTITYNRWREIRNRADYLRFGGDLSTIRTYIHYYYYYYYRNRTPSSSRALPHDAVSLEHPLHHFIDSFKIK